MSNEVIFVLYCIVRLSNLSLFCAYMKRLFLSLSKKLKMNSDRQERHSGRERERERQKKLATQERETEHNRVYCNASRNLYFFNSIYLLTVYANNILQFSFFFF